MSEHTPSDQVQDSKERVDQTIEDEWLRERIRRLINEPQTSSRLLRFLKSPTLTHFLFNACLAGLVGLGLTSFYDWQKAKSDQQFKHRETEMNRATQTFESVSELIGRRLQRTRRRLWGYEHGAPDIEKREAAYDEVLGEWNEGFHRNLALIDKSFGPEMKQVFQDVIAPSFSNLNDALDCYQTHKEHHNKDDRSHLAEIRKEIANEEKEDKEHGFNDCIYHFNADMLTFLKAGEVGPFITDTVRNKLNLTKKCASVTKKLPCPKPQLDTNETTQTVPQ